MLEAPIEILGLPVTPMATSELINVIARLIGSNRKAVIANHNLHSLYLAGRNTLMKQCFIRADYAFVDGMPVLWLMRCFGMRLPREKRTTSLDWMPRLLPRARTEGWRIFYLGSEPAVLETGLQMLKAQYPGLEVEGHHGHFEKTLDSIQNMFVIDRIRQFSPQILLVGMGMPMQECWVLENYENLPPCVIVTIGAYLDYIAGVKPTPPRWLGAFGFEWLYRLVSEPRRLSHRYLVEPFFVLKDVIAEMWRRRIRGGR